MKKTGTLLIVLLNFLFAFAQPPGATIDVLHYSFALQLNDTDNSIKGEATIAVKFLKDATAFNIDLVKKKSDGKGMLVSSVKENGKPVQFTQSDEAVTVSAAAKINTTHSYTITYSGIPADGLIISTNKFGNRTFFGDNWPNRAHNWLPCVDDPADKASVEFVVTAPDHYTVIANGLKTEERALANKQKLTHWEETAVLPTKVMVIGAADFAIDHTGDVNNIPVYSYVFPQDKTSGFKSYAGAKDILSFFIKQVGAYPYQKLANVQSKTIFGGMENASAIFYFENSVNSSGIEELMAHEIAHQWFGNSVSEKNFANLWLSEGFATYMTNYYLESKYGQEALKKRMTDQRTKILNFEKQRLTPVVDTTTKGDYMQQLNANSYEKGGWVLHMLRRKIGDDAFWKGVRAYYEKYKSSNANTTDLRKVMEQASGQDLQGFFKQWLLTAGNPQLQVAKQYDADKKQLTLTIQQKQNALYEMVLEYAVDGQGYSQPITGKTTTIKVDATNPSSLVMDPNVNLLATFEGL
ncbi:MAG: M1 family peptidase [Sphingobacteriaceae bacterium]|nr:MAG: M1 family peptidase [Sphingobacteriaceae bacterium]